jgi:hypothetical protein
VFPWLCGFATANLRKQRVCIKFCFKLGKTTAETLRMLKQAFRDNSLGQTQTYDWYKHEVSDWSCLSTPWLGSYSDYSPTAPADPSLKPLILSGTLIRCYSSMCTIIIHNPAFGSCIPHNVSRKLPSMDIPMMIAWQFPPLCRLSIRATLCCPRGILCSWPVCCWP